MNYILSQLRISLIAVVTLAVLLCGIYPAIVWGLAQILFPDSANGSLVKVDGKVVGSQLLAQNFTGAQYFHPRPSSAGDAGYDAANSGGSNLGPTSKKLIETVKNRIDAYRAENNLSAETPVPADAVTASGSGLDPHISLKNAYWQASRVAKARGMSENAVKEEIKIYAEGRALGVFGEPRVNVLKLNLALDGKL
jgi:potassium-transporting ATPase KdpC subunit